MPSVVESVYFTNKHGHKLAGRLERPEGSDPIAYAMMSHCFTCSKSIKSMGWISKHLAEQGVAVLRFDFAGLGESEGVFSETTFSTNLDDIAAAAAFLRERDRAPQILIGHSLGGTAMLAAAGGVPECRLVATIASPADTRHIRGLMVGDYPELLTQGEAHVSFGGRKVRILKSFLDDLETHRIEQVVADLNCAVMTFHSPADSTLGIDHSLRIFHAAKPPRYFITLDGADHLLVKREADSRYVAETIAAWVRRYLMP
jgi:putative redox protein